MSQKELFTEYAKELKKAWNDEKMEKFVLGKTAYVVEHNGKYYKIEKPTMKKDFCFGFGYSGVSTPEEYEAAENMAEYASSKEDYFREENLKKINSWIKSLKEVLRSLKNYEECGEIPDNLIGTTENIRNNNIGMFCITGVYLKDGKFYSEYGNDYKVSMDAELAEKLLEGMQEVKKSFEKRINTYLKRYGLSKVRSWSYLSD